MAAELYPAGELLSLEGLTAGEGIGVELVDDSSKYEELFMAKEGLVSVEHTLTLCSDRNLSEGWRDKEFLRHAAAEGVVAHITLLTGERLMVGWSPHFGFEQALRLRSLTFHSGSRPAEQPKVVLTLASRDTTSALDQ